MDLEAKKEQELDDIPHYTKHQTESELTIGQETDMNTRGPD